MQADQEKMESLSTAALQIGEQEARISHLEQQAAADKEAWRKEEENLCSAVIKLQEDIKEKDNFCSAIGEQLQQVLLGCYSTFSFYLSLMPYTIQERFLGG